MIFLFKEFHVSPLATISLPVLGKGASEDSMNLGQGQRMTASWVLLNRRTRRNEPPGQKRQPERSSLWRRVPQRDQAGAPASFPGSWRGPPCRGAGPLLQGRNLALGRWQPTAPWEPAGALGPATEWSSVPPGSGGRESGPPKARGIIIVMLTGTTVTAAAAATI